MEKSGGYPEDMFIDEVRIAIIHYNILFSHATYIIYIVNHIIIIFVRYIH